MNRIPEVSRVDFIVNLFSGGGRKRDFLDLYALTGGRWLECRTSLKRSLAVDSSKLQLHNYPFKLQVED
jgi:hypothetical protein